MEKVTVHGKVFASEGIIKEFGLEVLVSEFHKQFNLAKDGRLEFSVDTFPLVALQNPVGNWFIMNGVEALLVRGIND